MTTSPVASISDEDLNEIILFTDGPDPDGREVRGLTARELRGLVARLRAAEKELTEVTSSLPYSTYMDPPDGGDVSIPEQVRRMAKDAKRYLWVRERVGVLPEDCKTVWVLMDGCRMHDIERHETDQAIDLAMEQQP